MTEDFDLAVYIKGDRKSTALYSAQLVVEYGEAVPPDFCDLFPEDPSCIDPPPPVESEMAITTVAIPAKAVVWTGGNLTVKATNTSATETDSGSLVLENNLGYSAQTTFTNLQPGGVVSLSKYWYAPSTPQQVNWTITVKDSEGNVVSQETAVTTVQWTWWG
jgi:hypothetical protein